MPWQYRICVCVSGCKTWSKMGALEEVKTSWLLECGVGVQDWQLEDETNSLPTHMGHPSHLWMASVSKQEERGEAEIFILSAAGRATLDGASQSCSPMSEISTLRHPLKRFCWLRSFPALTALERSDEENFIAAKNYSELGKYSAQLLSVHAVA